MKILISNDDGINSKGLVALCKHLSVDNEILVVAPSENRSAVSHSLSINTKLKLNKVDITRCEAYSLSGTPVDCIKFSRLYFKNFIPDIVVAGINKGHNLVIYPEISDKGYLKELEGFHEGFDLLFDYCLKNNVDAPVFVSYYQVESKTYIFDKPIKISQLKEMNLSRKELANYLCNRCNELGKIDLNNLEK